MNDSDSTCLNDIHVTSFDSNHCRFCGKHVGMWPSGSGSCAECADSPGPAAGRLLSEMSDAEIVQGLAACEEGLRKANADFANYAGSIGMYQGEQKRRLRRDSGPS